MKDVITIKPGRPEGYESATCRHCEWEGYVPEEMLEKSNGGRWSMAYKGKVNCPHCGKPILIPRT